MPTVTPPPPTSTSPPVAPPSAPGTVTPVEAGIGNAPDKLQQLTHQIQVSGLITQPPDGGSITISTAIGNLTILLPLLTKEQQDQLTQQLTAMFQSQRPLTVVIQPGNPPAQAFMLLPSAAAPNASQSVAAQNNILLQAVTPPLQPLAPGVVLPAIVLPINTALGPNAVQTNPLANPFAAQPLPVGSLPSLPADGALAALPDALLLDELAAKAEAYTGQIIPQAEADISAGTVLPSAGFSPGIPATPPQTSLAGLPLSPPLDPLSLPVLGDPALPQPIPLALQGMPVAPQAAASPSSSSLLQPGMEVNLRVDAVALPSEPIPVPSLPNQITATVTGSGPNGQLLVQAGNVTLYVKQPTDAPVGSTLLLTVEPGRPPLLTPLPLPDAGNFGTLQQALTALAQADPRLAQQVMESLIPQPNAALGGALLFLLSAFRQGDLRSWLGNNAVDILSRTGKMELIAKLSQQLSEGGQAAHDSVVGAWRSYTVPMQANNQFHALQLYVHGDGRGGKESGESKPGAKAIRFLIDMRLSKLGALQLDGFVRPKQLDMIVRSEHVLPEGLNQDLRQTYIKSLEAVGYAGSLNFQIGRQHWLAIRKSAGAGSVVM